MPSTIEGVSHLDDLSGAPVLRRRRWLHRATFGTLAAILALAVADGVDLYDAYGVDDGEVSAAGDGVTLEVVYPSVTRPALASPFRVRVERVGGFDAPITIAVSRPWIEIWDANALYPSPSEETGDGDWVVWEFDPPDGTVFEVFYDGRLEPGRQTSEDGEVELRDADGTVLAAVEFTTRVRP